MRQTIDTFESWKEFLDHLHVREPRWANCSSKNKASDWSGSVDFQQAVLLAEYGWPEGRDLLTQVSLDMHPENVKVQEHVKEIVDVAGAYPIVPMAVAGDPAHMVDIQAQEVSSKIIEVAVSISHPAHIEPEALTANGAAVCSYIDALEAAGWRCEVVIYLDSKADNNIYRLRIAIKRAEEMLDLDRMVFALAHPGMLRKLCFRCMEIHKNLEQSHSLGYGRPATERPEGCQVYVDRVPDSSFTGDAALARVSECLSPNLKEDSA